MAAISAAVKSRTTASRAARRVTSWVVFQTYIRRPNSMMPSSTMKKTMAISANSTVATPRCGRTLEETIKGLMASSIHVAHGGVRGERDAGIAGGARNERHDAANGDGVAGNAYFYVGGRCAIGACRRRAGDDDIAVGQRGFKVGRVRRSYDEVLRVRDGDTADRRLGRGRHVPRAVAGSFRQGIVVLEGSREFENARRDKQHQRQHDPELDGRCAALRDGETFAMRVHGVSGTA